MGLAFDSFTQNSRSNVELKSEIRTISIRPECVQCRVILQIRKAGCVDVMIQIRDACSVYDSDACGRCLLGIRDGGVNEVFSGSFLVGSYMSESLLCVAGSLHLTPACSVSLLTVLMLSLDILAVSIEYAFV
jgi:hypothetical protein